MHCIMVQVYTHTHRVISVIPVLKLSWYYSIYNSKTYYMYRDREVKKEERERENKRRISEIEGAVSPYETFSSHLLVQTLPQEFSNNP